MIALLIKGYLFQIYKWLKSSRVHTIIHLCIASFHSNSFDFITRIEPYICNKINIKFWQEFQILRCSDTLKVHLPLREVLVLLWCREISNYGVFRGKPHLLTDIPIWITVFAAPPASASTSTQSSALTPALTPASSPVVLLTVQFIPLIVPVIVPPLAIFSFLLTCPIIHRYKSHMYTTETKSASLQTKRRFKILSLIHQNS